MLSACAAPLHRYAYTRLCMGVRTDVVVYAPREDIAASGAALAFDRLASLDDALSDYRPGSELNRFAGRAWDRDPNEVVISPDLARVLAASMELAEATGGAFDPTVGPMVTLWRKARTTGKMPESGSIDEARARVGWHHLRVRTDPPIASLDRGGMRLDLGGIAKGYAAREAVRELEVAGLPRCLVALAGDIAAGEAPPGERGWIVEIAPPGGPGVARAVVLRRTSVSTSGDAAQFVEIGGVRYSHIVNPRTGMGVTRRVQATVVSCDGARADALATALSVDPSLAPALARRYPEAGIVVEEITENGGRTATYGRVPWR